MDVSPRLLEQYVVLADERHFGRAAERLSLSQPSLSQAIQRLERLMGVRLLDRSSRTVELTQAGEAFAADAERLLSGQAAAIDRAKRIGSGTEGNIHVGHVSGVTFAYLPQLVAAAEQAHPELRLNLHQATSAALVELVGAGQIDIAFARGPLDEAPGIRAHELFTEHLGLVMPAGHPLTSRDSVELAELADEFFALPLAPSLAYLADLISAACRTTGFQPRVRGTADSLPGLISLVAAGKCLTLVPGEASGRMQPGVEFRPVVDTSHQLQLTTVAICRQDLRDPAVSRLLELAQSLR